MANAADVYRKIEAIRSFGDQSKIPRAVESLAVASLADAPQLDISGALKKAQEKIAQFKKAAKSKQED